MRVCQSWHRAFDKIQHGGIPVIAAMQGAVVGGGLELASAAHVRVADATTYFALPEGQRGSFYRGWRHRARGTNHLRQPDGRDDAYWTCTRRT